jgi:uncharacterized protein
MNVTNPSANASSDPAKPSQQATRSTYPTVFLLVLLGVLSALFYYKWGASLRIVQVTAQSGALTVSAEPFLQGALYATTAYFKKVWLALVYGVLIGATVRVVVPPERVAQFMGGKGARSMLTGALAGVPLMLCSCCVTPIFSGLHRQGARLGPSLAVMFAAPGLNIAGLVLTFTLFPARFGFLRLGAALFLVFGVASFVGRQFEREQAAKGQSETCEVPIEEPLTWRNFPGRWLRSIADMAKLTLPVMLGGVVLASIVTPHLAKASGGAIVVSILVTAFAASLIALPTFVEIPLALSLLALGISPGLAVAVLIAGPVVNLPSLLIVGKEVGWRVAVSMFFGVWLVASAAAMFLHFL